MERMSLENIEDYIVLNNELALEDPYILKITKDDFIKKQLDDLNSGCLDVFILYNDKVEIGFIELNKEANIAIIEKIYIREQYRSYDIYKKMLEFVHKYYYHTKIEFIEFIGLNDRADLIKALKGLGYRMEKEHIQMEKAITELSKSNLSIHSKTFFNIADDKWIYNFMNKCMENSSFNYKEEEVNELTHINNDLTFVLFESNHPIGFMISFINEARNKQENKNVIYIEQIGVCKEFRNQGYGLKLMEYVMENGKDKGMDIARLHVYRHNETAYRLYKKLGFNEIKSIGFWVKNLNN